MNITKYFFKNYEIGKYHYYDKYVKSISVDKYKTYPFEIIDDEQLISMWKRYLYPSPYVEDDECDFVFLAMSFYLLNEGYVVKQFPDLLKKNRKFIFNFRWRIKKWYKK